MAKVSSIYKSAYFRGSDIGDPIKLTIASCEPSEGGQYGPQIVLGFLEDERKLGLNRTNARTLVKAFGDETDRWIGRRVQVGTVNVRNPQTGDVVPGIVVVAAKQKQAAEA